MTLESINPGLVFFGALAVTAALVWAVIWWRQRRKRRVPNVEGRSCTNCKHRDDTYHCQCIACIEGRIPHWQPRKETE